MANTNFNITPLHYAISVTDIDATVSWYDDIFGFKKISDMYIAPAKARSASLEKDGFVIELFQHDEPHEMQPARLNPDLNVQDPGPQHIAFKVDNFDAFIEEITAKGVKIVVGPLEMGDIKLCYIADNSGIPIEVMTGTPM